MTITHTFCECIHCKCRLEIFDEDQKEGQVECPYCDYSNELTDIRLKIWEEEF